MFCLLTFRRHSVLFHMLFYGIKCKDVAYMEIFWYYQENMYSQLKSCVRTEDGLTDYFKRTIGTRQGCI